MTEIRKVPLRQIDLQDEAFSVNFMPDLEQLRSSIEEIGLIQPVLLRKKAHGYQIVCGFRRISVMEELQRPEIEARILAEKEKEDPGLFFISLHENLTTRGFNPVEKAIALEKLVHRFQVDPKAVVKTFLPLFSLETNEKILNTYLSLAGMEEEAKRYILKEEVSRSNIRKLALMSPVDRTAALSLFSFLKLGENSLREMLTLLEEVSRRDHQEVREIVERPEIQAILSHQELTSPQRTEKIKNVLMDFRYPRMRKQEEEFDRKRKDLNLPPSVVLRHPPFFEGNGLRIEFHVETIEEYWRIVSLLSHLSEKKEFEEMLQPPDPSSLPQGERGDNS